MFIPVNFAHFLIQASVDNGEPSPANKATIEQLEQEKRVLVNNISDLENELNDHKRKNLDWEHRFESEVSSLRNSIRQTEAKYSEVTATPPKVISLTFSLSLQLVFWLCKYKSFENTCSLQGEGLAGNLFVELAYRKYVNTVKALLGPRGAYLILDTPEVDL